MLGCEEYRGRSHETGSQSWLRIDWGASRHVASGLIIEHNDKSAFGKRPGTPEEQLAAWRAVLVCPTASVRSETKQPRSGGTIFPQEITSGVWRCGFNARSSFGAHSYFVERTDGNLLIDSPRYAANIVNWFRHAGGVAHILLSHRDDVADADKYGREFGARIWIHCDDCSAGPYATDLFEDETERMIGSDMHAIPLPGHTRGSVAYLLDDRVLFSGDSLAWSAHERDLVAFRDACWYSWTELTESLAKLAAYRFEWLLPGHGWPVHLPAREMNGRLVALVERMRKVIRHIERRSFKPTTGARLSGTAEHDAFPQHPWRDGAQRFGFKL